MPLRPAGKLLRPAGYDIFPTFPLPPGQIESGFDALAARLASQRQVTVDGDSGAPWSELRAGLSAALARRGVAAAWIAAADGLRPQQDIERLVAPFLGGADPLFGTRFTGELADFFDDAALRAIRPDPEAVLSIVYGPGAALAGWNGPLVLLEVPRSEQQFRSRAGCAANLGCSQPADPRSMYKRFYFVDWPALAQHKRELQARAELFVDAQRPDEPALISGEDLRKALWQMARNPFRPRPWFEPGPWGGQWMKQRIEGLDPSAPNYAWSFELIAPENGLLFESGGRMLEASFDLLMFRHSREVLGRCAGRFGCQFPIRFDFLDTVGGGNLSLQCHPRPEYIRERFGETYTQDETYYILDCEPGASVYLGFREGVNAAQFRADLERSVNTGAPVEVERYVQVHPAHTHDLFLIPNGTIHCSGAGNLVLEISATPYIFTFKMYDWLRQDLEGRPRPLNIDRAFENLRFERQGQQAARELVSRPCELESGPGWRLIRLPTHSEHFYDVHRLELEGGAEMLVETAGSCHMLNLVEGESIRVETQDGPPFSARYAETFVVPCAAGGYRLVNESARPARVVKAFVKPGVE